MVTQSGLYSAAAALVAALYIHLMRRLAKGLKRKFHPTPDGLAMLPIVALTIGLLYLELLTVQAWMPGRADEIGSATFLGLALGRMVPVPGGGAVMSFGLGRENSGSDDGTDAGSDTGADGGDGGSGH